MAKSLLVLGGTRFVGRAVVECAVSEGWEVTILHRGTRPAPEGVAEAVVADRTAAEGLDALPSRRWDAAIDTWAADPEIVRRGADFLRGRADRYAYVSSRSVYAWPAADGADESAPLVEPAAAGVEPDYAQSKRMAEDAVLDAFPASSLIARAGILLGPHEHPGRLPWWLGRLARGGEVPVPGTPDVDMQYLDARDLAAWLLRALRAGIGGIFNAVGPVGGTTMGALMESCLRATGSSARLQWIDPAIVLETGITPWTELPLWLPPGERHAALYRGDVDAIHQAGLVERPLDETVADTWAWMNSEEGRRACAGITLGLTEADEIRLLQSAR